MSKLNKYIVEVEWCGYSRGYSQYEVEAESEEEARDNYWDGEKIFHETVRDDTEGEVASVEKVSNEQATK